jgi:lyso-ornithine lipid O-acyltransferase
MLRPIFKALGFFGRAAGFIVKGSVARLVIRDPLRQRRFAIRSVSRTSARILKGFDIRVRPVNFPDRAGAQKPFFVIANHTSDVDIPVLASVMPVVFLPAADVGETGFLGTLTKLGGIQFVERRSASGMITEIEKIRHLLEQGYDVALFPEGRTSDGRGLHPFKSGLLQAAIDAGASILPVCINYLAVGGEKLSLSNRDQVLYYGDMGFGGHLRRVLSAGTIEIECRFLPPIPTVRSDSRKALCQRVYQAILSEHKSI